MVGSFFVVRFSLLERLCDVSNTLSLSPYEKTTQKMNVINSQPISFLLNYKKQVNRDAAVTSFTGNISVLTNICFSNSKKEKGIVNFDGINGRKRALRESTHTPLEPNPQNLKPITEYKWVNKT
jgi:hypothetical protein